MELPSWLNEETLIPLLTTWGLRVLAAVAVLVIGWIIVALICRALARRFAHHKTDPTVAIFVVKIAYGLLLVLVFIAALSQMGVAMTSFVAVLAAAGLAVALALQGTLSNFASGTMLISARPMKAGDFVECAGVSGVLDYIGIFYTQLHTVDNQVITIANTLIMEQPLTNYSTQDKRRFNEIIGIGYDDDIKQAKEVIEKVLSDESRLLDDPPAQILISALGPSSVDLSVRCWIRTADFVDVRSDLLENLKTALDAAGISIPFPQQDVHLYQVEGKST